MAELIDPSNYHDFTLETLKTPDGVTRLNSILRQLAQNISSDGESVKVYQGTGTPESSVSAGVGSLYMRTDGGADTSVYRKESGSGNTGWVAIKAPAALPLSVTNGGTGSDLSSTAQGSILYFSATGVISVLTPGTSGQLLKTQGASANPIWATVLGNTAYASGTFIETYSMPIVTSTSSATPQKLKELSPMIRSGVVSVSFDYASNNNAATNARIYLNGVATGTNRSDNLGTFSTYTEDITVAVGDLLQLYGNGDGSSTSAVVCNLIVKVTVPTLPQDNTNPFGKVFRGAGIPNPNVGGTMGTTNQAGNQGDIYLRTDGSTSTTLYVKTDVATWTAK